MNRTLRKSIVSEFLSVSSSFRSAFVILYGFPCVFKDCMGRGGQQVVSCQLSVGEHVRTGPRYFVMPAIVARVAVASRRLLWERPARTRNARARCPRDSRRDGSATRKSRVSEFLRASAPFQRLCVVLSGKSFVLESSGGRGVPATAAERNINHKGPKGPRRKDLPRRAERPTRRSTKENPCASHPS